MNYYKTTTIIDHEGNEVATLEDVEITADELIKILAAAVTVKETVLLAKPAKLKVIKVKKLKELKVPKLKKIKAKSFDDAMINKIRALKARGLSVKEITEEVGLSKSTVYRIYSGQVQPGGTTLTKGNGKSKDEMRQQIAKLAGEGKKAQEIADIVGLKVANVYYYLKATATHKPAKEMPETATKWGEREIDKAPEIIGADDWKEIKEGHDDGMSLGPYKISMPQYELQEMQRAVAFDTYEDYQASRK